MADTKITILGMSGSGKTCYLLGLYYDMGAGRDGFSLVTAGEDAEDRDVELRNRYSRMCNASLSNGKRFPVGTAEAEYYEFTLQHGFEDVLSFDWVDYPGGRLRNKTTESVEEYEKLKKTINQSSCLFLCVDGRYLSNDVGNSVEEKESKIREECSNVLNTFLSQYNETNDYLPPVVIIVTKYDECMEEIRQETLAEIIEKTFSPLYIKSRKQKLITIVPVSIGLNIKDENFGGKFMPLNIHLPVFVGIVFALREKIQKIKDLCNLIDTNVNKVRKKIGKEKQSWFKSESKIKKYEDEMRRMEEERRSWFEFYADLELSQKKMVKELDDKLTLVYLNGSCVRFKEAFDKWEKKSINSDDTSMSIIKLLFGVSTYK